MPDARKPGEFGPITARDREHMRVMDADGEWFDNLPVSELKKLAGKYVAVKDKQIVAASRSMTALSAKLRRLGLEYVYISLVEEPGLVIYTWSS